MKGKDPLRGRAATGDEPESLLVALRRASDLHLATGLILLLAFILTGFAHQPVFRGSRDRVVQTAQIAASSAAGIVICSGSRNDARLLSAGPCEACMLAAAPGLLPRSPELGEPANTEIAAGSLSPVHLPADNDPLRPGARAPPASIRLV